MKALPLSLKSIMPFGKYQGRTIGDIISRDPNYVSWALNYVGGFDLDEKARIAYKRKRFWQTEFK